ncbi:MAG: HAD family hydrolase [Candidatus Nanoarchaeia archaeon]|nr:HAD family hydrolase [Candidatus Nanoarchaeia archaeon]
MKKLICFDMDNTLINSDKGHFHSYMESIEKFGFKRISYWRFLKLMGMPKEQVVREIIGYGKKENLYKKINDLQAKLIEIKYVHMTKALRGTKRVLKKLKKDYKLAVTSNCSHRTILNLLKSAGINYRLFEVIVGNDDVRISKPAPSEIRKASKILHTRASYVVGDSIYDIMAAKRAKVKVISVLTGHYSREDLKRRRPDYIVSSLRQLPRLLKKIENES